MSTVTTNSLRINSAKRFATTVTGSYAFIGKPTVWSSTSDTPPVPNNSVAFYNDVYNQMLSLKRVDSSSIYHLIRRINWTSGLVYDVYRHDYTPGNTSFSGATNIYDANYIVINQNNNVYACLDNKENTVSSVEPLSEASTPFYTSDGYQWIKLYGITSSVASEYSTSTLIPVMETDLVSYQEGSISTVIIDTHGTNYTDRPSGVINTLPYYYCQIAGDGTGAVARITVDSGSVSEVQVVRPGQNYTFGNVVFEANKVYETLSDLDQDKNALNPEGNGDFRSTVIIPPSGGWGTDIISEVGATTIGIFSSFGYAESDFINDVTYRQIGLLKGVETTQVNPSTAAAYRGIKVNDLGGITDYVSGELISQSVAVEGEDDTFVTARAIVVDWDSTNGVIFYIQDPKTCADTDGNLYGFSGSGTVVGESSTKITSPDVSYSASLLGVTFVDGYSEEEITKFTGDLIYISNKAPIQRTSSQSEKLNFILTF